ncbi:lipase 1-like [Aricia agestis]|uniref:lipase 1-like n=1 Tax=Aricia agestis TaxID=91739 RepID=UPI001C20B200|nr:lipase 1-like [Aricia agestis]
MYAYVLLALAGLIYPAGGKPACVPHARQNFTELARASGLGALEYEVQTDDYYFLKLFRIPGAGPPVLLMHGIFDSADTFVVRGNGSLAAHLARRGYDVWVGNARGSWYSRRHLYLDPDRDDEFWDYSFHEIGVSDLPAMIDFVLEKTGRPRLSAVGHSQGNTIFYVLGAMRPEYNAKIDVMIALSPVCFLNNLSRAVSILTEAFPLISGFLAVAGREEVFGEGSVARVLYEEVCGCGRGYDVCARRLYFPIAGADPHELGPDFFPTVVRHYPTSTSRKNLLHSALLSLRKSFSQYDYGPLNLDLYNSTRPPRYELRNVAMPIALLVGQNDGLSAVKDVEALRDSLPNVVEYVVLPYERFNHVDAVWGRHMNKYLFPYIDRVLQKYASDRNITKPEA